MVKAAILLTCFAVVFAEETTTSKATTKTPKKTTSTTTAAPVNKNQNNNNQETTTSKSTTKPTKKTTATTTSASVNSTCGNCLKVTTRDNDCVWNPEEESKTDFHYDKIGNCPCPDDPTKDRCNVVQRRVRNIPALQAWSACLFLLSICIAGLYFCFWMVNISPLNIPPYNKYVFIIAVLLLLICITSWVGMSPAVTPRGPPIASIMNVFKD